MAGGRHLDGRSDSINRCEVFDEEDLGAALARLEELHPQTPRLENAASQVDQRFWIHFAARDWNAMAEMLADDISTADRRRVVNSGVRRGRDDHIAEMRAVAEMGTENIAVDRRGDPRGAPRPHSYLRLRPAIGAGEFSAEVLNVIEIDAEKWISVGVGFDVDDVDAAIAELEARYVAGEAADSRAHLVRHCRGLRRVQSA